MNYEEAGLIPPASPMGASTRKSKCVLWRLDLNVLRRLDLHAPAPWIEVFWTDFYWNCLVNVYLRNRYRETLSTQIPSWNWNLEKIHPRKCIKFMPLEISPSIAASGHIFLFVELHFTVNLTLPKNVPIVVCSPIIIFFVKYRQWDLRHTMWFNVQ